MVAYNQVILIGNLTRDPEIKEVGNAKMKMARLSLCINERRKTADGKLIDNPVFVDVEAWARLAEMCEKYLSKNSNIFVEGRLQSSQWEKDGVRHQKVKVRASNIKFLPKGDRYAGSKKKMEFQPSKEFGTAVREEDAAEPIDDFEATMNSW